MRKRLRTVRFFAFLSVLLWATCVSVVAVGYREGSVSSSIKLSADWWPMFRHDLTHVGYSTSKGPSTNNTIWRYTFDSEVWSSPAVVNSKVYASSSDGNVYALDASTGSIVWNYTVVGMPTGMVTSSPAVVDGKVFIGSISGNVYALDASTGTPIWNYTTGHAVWSSPAVDNDKVYVGSMDGNLYALDVSTGTMIWSYATGGGVWSSPAVDNDKVYVGSSDGNVYALDALTGTQIWNYTTDGEVRSSPAVVDGNVFVGSFDGNVYALDALTGTQIWNYTTGYEVWSSPAVADGKVYIGSMDHNLYALDALTGTQIWNYLTKGAVISSPAVADGIVYAISWDHNIYAFGPPELKPPIIGVPTCMPSHDVTLDKEVTVSVNVTDAKTGVKNVTLFYTTDEGFSWLNLQMKYNSTSGLYETTIPGQLTETWVKYKIVAFNNAERWAVSDNEGKYYVYQVIETPSVITTLLSALPILAILGMSIIVVVLVKKLIRKKS